jgi:predicted permease
MRFTEDVRLGVRALRREPGFCCAAIFTLALSIAANTSVFTVVKSILLEPLAMKRPQELVALQSLRPDGTRYPFTIPFFLELRRRNQVLADAAAYGGWNANLTGEADPERLPGVRASGNYFGLLGVQAEIGRLLEPKDDEPGQPKVVVITDGFWRRRYGGDPAAIGKPIRLNNEAYVLVGVLPPSFSFKTAGQELAVPLSPATDPWRNVWTSTAFLRVFGRLKSGVTPAEAQAGLSSVAAGLRREYPEANAMITGIEAVPLQQDLTGGSRTMLLVLMCAVGLVLLIACANLSSLMLARAAKRQKEMAIRVALGATRWSVARRLLVESLLLFAAGGISGIVAAQWGVWLLLSVMPAELPRFREVRLDWVVLSAAAGATMLCGLLFGSIPAMRAPADLNDALRADGRGSTAGPGRSRVRALLVILEASLSLVLLAGAGLLLKSFDRLMALDPGFRASGVTTFRLALPSTRYKTAAPVVRFHDRLRQRIEVLPGVMAAGATSILPLSGPMAASDFTIVGNPPATGREKPTAQYRMVDAAYFRAMGIPIRNGRGFADSDTQSSPAAVVISESLAGLYWNGANPIGSRLRMEDNSVGPREVEVIGVAGNVREMSLEEGATPCVYVAMAQIPQDVVRFLTNNMFWAIRTNARLDVTSAVRREIRDLDGDVAAVPGTMQQYVSKAVATRRFTLGVLTAFALAALLLAAGGLYALVAYSTAQRRREFAVRIALGARPKDVAGLVLRQGLVLAAAGVAIGAAAAWGCSRFAASLLFDVSPQDPAAIGSAAALLLAVAAAACYVPARRAVRADPVEALRAE